MSNIYPTPEPGVTRREADNAMPDGETRRERVVVVDQQPGGTRRETGNTPPDGADRAAAGGQAYAPMPDGETRRERVVATDSPPDGTRRETANARPDGESVPDGAAMVDGNGKPRRKLSGQASEAGVHIVLPAELAANYQVIKDLRGGSEANLAVVRNLTTGAETVFKLYRPGISTNALAMEGLRSADPSHIVRILDFGESPAGAWELLEYCPTGSLREWFSAHGGRPLPPETLQKIVREIAAALRHIHEKGIAHHDLKPANVLVRDAHTLDLVLTDFGLARAHSQVTRRTATAQGTWHYAAPEVHGDEPQFTTKSDWFSLGAMIYEFATGRFLFDTNDEVEAKRRCRNNNYSTHRVTDPVLRRLIDGLVTWEKDNRWGASQVEAWLAYVERGIGELPRVVRSSVRATNRVGYQPRWSTEVCFIPEDLAAQMRLHWADAEAELYGRVDEGMLAFISEFTEWKNRGAVLAVLRSNGAPFDRMVELQWLLDPPSAGAPAIEYFTAVHPVVPSVQDIAFEWETYYATKLQIRGPGGVVFPIPAPAIPGCGSINVPAVGTGNYTLEIAAPVTPGAERGATRGQGRASETMRTAQAHATVRVFQIPDFDRSPFPIPPVPAIKNAAPGGILYYLSPESGVDEAGKTAVQHLRQRPSVEISSDFVPDIPLPQILPVLSQFAPMQQFVTNSIAEQKAAVANTLNSYSTINNTLSAMTEQLRSAVDSMQQKLKDSLPQRPKGH